MVRLRVVTRRRWLLGGVIAAGAGLAASATAFACIYMQGTFTVCGDESSSTYSVCTTSTGTSATTGHNFTYTQTGSTSALSVRGTAKVSATGLVASTTYWVKYWDPVQTAAIGDFCPAYGRPLGTLANPVPAGYTTDGSGDFGPTTVLLAPDTVTTGPVGPAYVCTTDSEVGPGSTGNTAAITLVPV